MEGSISESNGKGRKKVLIKVLYMGAGCEGNKRGQETVVRLSGVCMHNVELDMCICVLLFFFFFFFYYTQ